MFAAAATGKVLLLFIIVFYDIYSFIDGNTFFGVKSSFYENKPIGASPRHD